MANVTFDFTGYHVIVTGGTRGIGKAISEAFLTAGASVVATYQRDDASSAAFIAAHKGRPLETMKFDVSDYHATEKFFEEYDKTHTTIEVLVNNAGIRKDGIVAMMPVADWHAVLETNLSGTFNMSKLAVMRMSGRRFGRIISITSPSGKHGFQGQANYAAAKAGQVAFTKSLSKEVARRSITVNCVSPGFIDTDLLSDIPEEQKAAFKEQVPLRRFGAPEDIAAATLFLASTQASYITGSVLEVTGGL